MPSIRYVPDYAEIDIPDGTSILQASLQNNIPHIHVCGGNARCSTCRVMVLEGVEYCPPRNDKEQKMADKLCFPADIRLSCQTQPTGSITVRRLVLDDEDIAVTEQRGADTVATAVGIEKKAAIMFADIRGFTSFSESHVPYDVIHLLNRYYHRIGRVIREHHGYIDNYIGDGIMALFGMEEQPEEAPYNAVKAGLAMLEAVAQMRPYVQEIHNWELRIGVGIHYGEIVVGDIGGTHREHLTAIGDAVNFASRIESQNKEVGTELLISTETMVAIRHSMTIGKSAAVSVKGKSGEYQVYEVLAIE
jgi:adenylate cyclase